MEELKRIFPNLQLIDPNSPVSALRVEIGNYKKTPQTFLMENLRSGFKTTFKKRQILN